MFFSADQLVVHAVGDYVLQSDWMANEKTKKSMAALVHALSYMLPFLLLTRSPLALAVIAGTHFIIDRWRLARFVCFAKNFLAPKATWPRWEECSQTGYHTNRPPFMAVWLLIITDNLMHITINAFALNYL
jgi:dolichol kinase